jgi:hypothetical protein
MKKDSESEFRHEIKQYKKRSTMQGYYLPVYYGIGLVDETMGILLSYCGATLEE